MLVLLGGVMQVSATKRIWVDLSSSNNNWTTANAITAIHYAGKNFDNDYTPMTIVYMYGKKWCYYDVDDNVTLVVLKRYNPNNTSEFWNKTQDITWSDSNDKYIKIGNASNDVFSVTNIDAPSWNNIVMRNNYISGESGGWTNWQHNTIKDGDVFSYELTKAEIDSKSYLKDQGLRFRFHHGDKVKYDDCGTDKGDKYPEIAPKVAGGVAAPFDTDITDYCQDENSGNYWQVTLPDYDYEKLVFVADYSTHSWKIRVDAYITKEVSGTNEYATLGCSVPLEIVEANGVTAYPLTANASTGKITKGDAITVIPANEGALLENATGENQTIRAKVLASASSSASNQLVAFTGSGKLTQPTSGNSTYYILTKMNDKVGFYKVNSTYGNSMGANTAYLAVNGTLAREFFALDGETTGIANVDVNANIDANAPMYNLAGQRVNKSYKGVVIVNGKKMLNK